MSMTRIIIIAIAVFCLIGFSAPAAFAGRSKRELIKANGFRRDKKDNDPEIHLKNGFVFEAKKNGHLEVERRNKDIGDRFVILPNKQGNHDVFVISKRKFIMVMKNVRGRRDKGDGDWEVMLSAKWDLWFEIDTDCESKEFLMGELETGRGKDIDLMKLFGKRR